MAVGEDGGVYTPMPMKAAFAIDSKPHDSVRSIDSASIA